MILAAVLVGVLLTLPQGARPFTNKCIRNNSDRRLRELAAEPRAGIGQALLNAALNSPVWTYVLVPVRLRKFPYWSIYAGLDHMKE